MNKTEDAGDPTVQEEGDNVVDQGNAQEAPTRKDVYWPEDFLAEDFADLRIMTYGYDSKLENFFGTVPRHNLFTLAGNLLTSVANKRTSCVSIKDRPKLSLSFLIWGNTVVNASSVLHLP